MRLDKYLKVSRLIKRRTVANEVADAGRILINGKIAKASQAVKAGDIIEVTFGNRPIKVKVESRARLTVTGVQKVLHCNADSAAMETGKGTLHLTGAQLNMAALDLETGEAKFTGRIDTLEYTASVPAGGFLRRLLR